MIRTVVDVGGERGRVLSDRVVLVGLFLTCIYGCFLSLLIIRVRACVCVRARVLAPTPAVRSGCISSISCVCACDYSSSDRQSCPSMTPPPSAMHCFLDNASITPRIHCASLYIFVQNIALCTYLCQPLTKYYGTDHVMQFHYF